MLSSRVSPRFWRATRDRNVQRVANHNPRITSPKCFNINTYEFLVCNSFNINTYKSKGLKVLYHQHLQKRGGAGTEFRVSYFECRLSPAPSHWAALSYTLGFLAAVRRLVYYALAKRFQAALEQFIRRRYNVSADVAVSRPPRLEMGEIASPVCLQLAKQLKRAPRQIAEEIRAEIGPIEGIARMEVAGAGYLNAFLDRAAFWREALRESAPGKASAAPKRPGKVIVEHTSINPNKAAHIGHVRNAVLGDTAARQRWVMS